MQNSVKTVAPREPQQSMPGAHTRKFRNTPYLQSSQTKSTQVLSVIIKSKFMKTYMEEVTHW